MRVLSCIIIVWIVIAAEHFVDVKCSNVYTGDRAVQVNQLQQSHLVFGRSNLDNENDSILYNNNERPPPIRGSSKTSNKLFLSSVSIASKPNGRANTRINKISIQPSSQIKLFSSISQQLRGGAASTGSTRINPPPIANDSFRPQSSSSSSSFSKQQQQQQSQPPPLMATSLSSSSSHDQRQESKEAMDAFLTRYSRNSFISRVYAILSGQLLFTGIVVLLFGLYPNLSFWMKRPGSIGRIVPIISLLLSSIAWIIMSISPTARRVAPIKWQLLSLFTVGEALSVGFITSFYEFRSVLLAVITTAIAAASVSIYTITQNNPKYDLSQWGSTLSSIGCIFLLYGVIILLQVTGVLPPNFIPYSDTIYGMIGATLFSAYLAYHTKLIVSGKHTKYQLNEQDYVYGAMALYNDIINMFIYILRIIGKEEKE